MLGLEDPEPRRRSTCGRGGAARKGGRGKGGKGGAKRREGGREGTQGEDRDRNVLPERGDVFAGDRIQGKFLRE